MKFFYLTGFPAGKSKKEWGRIMHLTLFFIVGFFIAASASSYSQNTRLDVKLHNETVTELMKYVEENSEFVFLYRNDELDMNKQISVNLESATIQQILEAGFKNQNIKWEVHDRQIILRKGENNIISQQQQKRITGVVTDTNGMPLPRVTVVVTGTTMGTITNSDGEFNLSIPSGAESLQFTFVGMRTQEVMLEGRSNIVVVLEEDMIGIEEVVAIGYGTVKKSDLTGSVSSVSLDEIGDRVVSDIGQIIQGKVAGVDVSRDRIRIRGVTTLNNTDPLIVVDGFIGENMATVNPNDIESIEVLKDASSTAIYGSRGANGVILINTKNGKAGPLKVNINAFAGVESPSNKLDMLNADQYVDYAIDALTNGGVPVNDKFYSGEVRRNVTDWQDAITKTSPVQEVNINFSGGSENSTFLVSMGYNHHESVVINPTYDEGNIRIKNRFNIKKWLTAGQNTSLNYTYSKGALPVIPNTSMAYFVGVPYMPIYDDNNYWGFSSTDLELSGDAENAYAYAALSHPQSNDLSYQVNLWTEIEPLKGLVYRIQAGASGLNSRFTEWNDKYNNKQGTEIHANYTEKASYSINPVIESYLTYSKNISNHDFSIMLGNSWQNYSRSGGIGIYGEDFELPTVKNVFVANTRSVLNQDFAKYASLSYFGRLNYDYSNRYLLTVNFRRDGSPRFAPKNRWANFPSVALAWKISEENFIKNTDFIDLLKLRASWGISGNDAIGSFRYLSQVWSNGVYTPVGEPPVAVPGATVINNASSDIKWESTTSKTIGVDVAILNNSLTGTAEYFIKNTDDILFAVPRSSSLGYGSTTPGNAIVNAASVENRGYEFQVGYRKSLDNFRFTINANYTSISNKVTGLGAGQPYLDGFNRTAMGFPIGYLYGYVAEGVFMNQAELDAANQSARDVAFANNPELTPEQVSAIYYQYSTTAPGDVKFKDVDGDGTVTGEDRTMIGNSIPKNLYGFNFSLDFYGFDVNAFFQGVAGSYLYTQQFSFTRSMSRLVNQEAYVLNRWRSESEPGNGLVPRAIVGDPTGNRTRPSSLFVSSGDYLKLKQLSIGYTLSQSLVTHMGLTNLRLYTSGYNLLTFTNYEWFDPEISSSNLSRGQDATIYPTPRTIIFGVQIGL